jgi:hypothetical protein
MRLKTWIRRKLFPELDYYMETERAGLFSRNAELAGKLQEERGSSNEYAGKLDILQSDHDKRGDFIAEQHNELIAARQELGRLRLLCYNRGKLIANQAQENRELLREVQRLMANARFDDEEYEELYDKYQNLWMIFNNPGEFQGMLEKATGGEHVWDHWAVQLLVHSFEQTLGNGTRDRVAFLFGKPGTKSCIEVTLHRAETPSIAEKLVERVEVIESLLAILREHTLGPNPTKGLFTILFNGNERAILKQAAQIVRDSKPADKESAA